MHGNLAEGVMETAGQLDKKENFGCEQHSSFGHFIGCLGVFSGCRLLDGGKQQK